MHRALLAAILACGIARAAAAEDLLFEELTVIHEAVSVTSSQTWNLAGPVRVTLDGGVSASAPVRIAGGAPDRPAVLDLGGRIEFTAGLRVQAAAGKRQLLVRALPGSDVRLTGPEVRVSGDDARQGQWANAYLDLSAATNVAIDVERLRVGVDYNSGGDYQSHGALILAPRTDIRASEEVRVSHHEGHVNWNSPGAMLVLGAGTNTISTPLFAIGTGQESVGLVRFGARGGVLSLQGVGGGRADLVIGDSPVQTSRTRWGEMDFSGGVLNARLGSVSIGRTENTITKYSDNRSWGRLKMGAGQLDATEIVVGDFVSSIGSGPGGWLTVQGGSLNLGKGGLVITRGSSPRPHEWKLTPLIGSVLLEDAHVTFNGGGIKCGEGRDIEARLVVRPGSVLDMNGQAIGKLKEFTLEGGCIRNSASIATTVRIAGSTIVENDRNLTTYFLGPIQRVGCGTLVLDLVKGSCVLGTPIEADGTTNVLTRMDSANTVLGFTMHPSRIISPWIVQRKAGGVNFVALHRQDWGAGPALPAYVEMTAADSNSVVSVARGNSVSGGGKTLYALKNAGTVAIEDGQALTVAGRGLILDGGAVTGGTLAFDREGIVYVGDDSTVAGTVKGEVLTKFGPGRLTLAGPVAIGQVNVNAGVLALRGATTGEVRVAGSAVIEIADGAQLGNPLRIEGGGGLRSMRGTNVLAGPLTIPSGAYDKPCLIRSDARIDVVSGTLVVTGPVLSDRVSNNASKLVKAGPGRLVLASGGNTYLGGTVIEAGELQTTTASLPGSVINQGSLVLNQQTNGTLRGVYRGSGGLVKAGKGRVLFLSGSGDGTGRIDVRDGVLAAYGTGLGSGPVTVHSGGTLEVAPSQSGLLGEFLGRTYSVQFHRFAYRDIYSFNNKHDFSILEANLATLATLFDGALPAVIASSAENAKAFVFDRGGPQFPRAFRSGANFFHARWTGMFLAKEAGEYTFIRDGRGTDLVAIDGQEIIGNYAFSGAQRVGRVTLTPGWHDLVVSGHIFWAGMEMKLAYIPPSPGVDALLQEPANSPGGAVGDPVQPKISDKKLQGEPVPNELLAFNAKPELVIGALAGDGRVALGAGRLRIARADVADIRRRIQQSRIVSDWVAASPGIRRIAVEPEGAGVVVKAVEGR